LTNKDIIMSTSTLELRTTYPIDQVPDEIAIAIGSIAYLTQAPSALCGQSVLAAVNFAVQAHFDVQTDYGPRPLSEFFITLGQSGERKSSVDKLALQGYADWEAEQFIDYDSRKADRQAEIDQWEQDKAAILKDKALDKRKKAMAIEDLGDRPRLPLLPKRLVREPTQQGLIKLYSQGFPSLGMFSDEAGSFLGGYAMNKDNSLHMAASLSDLWDAKPLERIRAGEDLGLLFGRRLASHLMLQPSVATKLLDSPIFSGQGLTARMLVACPESTVGQRLHRRTAEERAHEATSRKYVHQFAQRIKRCLETLYPHKEGDIQQLAPMAMRMTDDARAIWLDWTDEVERQSAPGGLLVPIVSLANKAGEHAARLAGTMAAFQYLNGTGHKDVIEVEDMRCGLELMNYYLGQTLGLLGTLDDETEESRDYELLDKWVQEWGMTEAFVCYTNIANDGPRRLRKRKDLIEKFMNRMIKLGVLVPMDEPQSIKGKVRRAAYRIERD
jgi:hypothetical protein